MGGAVTTGTDDAANAGASYILVLRALFGITGASTFAKWNSDKNALK